jgi:CheY-like chemotaxis protein
MVPALVATGLLPRRRTTHRLIAGRHHPYLGLQGLRHGSDGKRRGRGSRGVNAVLMDFRLAGGGSGLAAERKIRENADMENADMPIVFCTAYAEEAGLAEQMLAVRHAALIPKPVSRAKLEQALTQLFAGD